MSKIESTRNLTIHQNLNPADSATFFAPINAIGFEPDEIVVRSIVANGGFIDPDGDANATDFHVYLIYCDLLENDQILGTFTGSGWARYPQPFVSNPQTTFRIQKPIASVSSIGFRIQSNKTTAETQVNRILSISLDFIKYEDKKNKK